jgi:proteasome lid subunit RPN8/RPN11
VLRAAGLATHVAIDWTTERRELPDELVEVIEPIEPPFDLRGLLAPRLVPEQILIVEDEAADLRKFARDALPNETGGILLGFMSDGEPLVTRCVHLPPASPSPRSFTIENGATADAVKAAQTAEPTIGYLGEWHSHPSDQPASAKDRETMARITGTGEPACPILIVACPQAGAPHRLRAYGSTTEGLAELPVRFVGRPQT